MFQPSNAGLSAALDRALATIEFTPEGTILTANANFLDCVGYTLDEIKGKPHGIFVDTETRGSADYRHFWHTLEEGEFQAGRFRRIAKNGKAIWLQATYNPVLNGRGKPIKVIKFAADITEQKRRDAALESRMAAVDKVQAVIEFDLDGRVITANRNFLDALGYSLDEVKGQHHRMFVDPIERDNQNYRHFWERLRRGELDKAQYRRIGKGGREVFIEASYNPILDEDGRPCSVVKFATDVTQKVRLNRMMETVVHKTADLVAAAGQKDLTRRVPTEDLEGEIGELATGVNALLDTLAYVVHSVRGATRTTLASAAEIASGSSELARRTEQQATSLERTVSTTEELSSSVKAAATSSRQAVNLSEQALAEAGNGGLVVGEAVDAIVRIEQASRKISDITDVIDGIAFQTNLLALNAAVEAARAGEAGKGFAVVASEVRTLAQRSASAAKDITLLIATSEAEVAEGVKLVRRAGEALTKIVAASREVSATVSDISIATDEQASGIVGMSRAFSELDEITQQNAALAEQSSASAASLTEHIEQLDLLISGFQTSLDDRPQEDMPQAGKHQTPMRRIA
jgi:methyl-accepting chemotaxis protein